MALNPYKIKLHRIKGDNGGFYQYSMTYKNNKDDVRQAGYDILSSLLGNSDLIIEFNTELFTGSSWNPEQCAEKFLKDIRSLCLEYNSIIAPSKAPVIIFGINTGITKKSQVHKIAAYAPNTIWKTGSIKDILPVCGARYYITKEPMDPKEAVENLFSLPEEQKAAMFKMVLFNMAELARFGIVTAQDMEEDLRRLLGLR